MCMFVCDNSVFQIRNMGWFCEVCRSCHLRTSTNFGVSPKLKEYFGFTETSMWLCSNLSGPYWLQCFLSFWGRHLKRRYVFWCSPSEGFFQCSPLLSIPQRDLLPLSLVPLRKTATIWRKWQSLLNHSVVFLLLTVSYSLCPFVSV